MGARCSAGTARSGRPRRAPLVGLLLLAACGPSLDAVVEDVVQDGFQGVIHVEHRGETLLLDAWGTAIVAGDGVEAVPHTPRTVFSVGSLTKQFTAAAVLEARERGLLALDDTLGDHFEGVPRDRRGITLHELLTHTSGLPPALGDDVEVVERDAYLRRAWDARLRFEPGRDYQYSNTGYSVLAAVLEQQTGLPYDTILQRWFFAPLGMDHTGYESPDWSDATIAHGYGVRADDVFGPPLTATYDTDGPYWHLTGNGGVLSTAPDMRTWVDALAGGDVLPRRALDDLWGRHVQTWPGGWYGYGWGVEEWYWMGDNVNHDGGNGYFYAHVVWWPEDELYVALYANHDGGRYGDLAWRLSRAVLR